jgi:hypothetical protein
MRVYVYCSFAHFRLFRSVAVMLGAAKPESPFATCPDCGTIRLRQLVKSDTIERVSRLPWNTLQKAVGGKLYLCRACRLQFYDCRKLAMALPYFRPPARLTAAPQERR